MKKPNLYKTLSLTLATILLLSTIYYAWALTPSTPIWISSGVYPGAPSYTIWKEGSNYFAKDINGYPSFSGTNASKVINDAKNALTTGTIYIANSINLTAPIIGKTYVDFKGSEYGTVITLASNICAFNLTGIHSVKLSELKFLVTKSSYASSVIYIGDNTRQITLEDLYIEGKNQTVSGTGIHISPISKGVYRTTFSRITFYYFDVGILFEPTGAGGWINGNSFNDLYFWYTKNSLYFKVSEGAQAIQYNNFFHIEAQTDVYTEHGILMNETTGKVWYNAFFGVTIFDLIETAYSAFISQPLNTFINFSPYSEMNGTQIYGSFLYADGFLKLRYVSPEPDPEALGWGLADRGFIWYCGTHNKIEYWNGTDIITP